VSGRLDTKTIFIIFVILEKKCRATRTIGYTPKPFL